jgi:hypothetical protein
VEIESESQSQKTRPICKECIQNKQKSRHYVTQLRAVPPSIFHASVPLSNVHLPVFTYRIPINSSRLCRSSLRPPLLAFCRISGNRPTEEPVPKGALPPPGLNVNIQ